MKRLTFEELIQLIPFPEYLINKGYEPVKKKSTTVHKVFEKKGISDEVIVTKHKNPPHNWVYKSVHDPLNDKGNIINFVVNRLNGYVSTTGKQKDDYAKVSEQLNNYLGIPVEERTLKLGKYNGSLTFEQKREPFNYHLFGSKIIEDFSYLSGRYIDKNTIENDLFRGKIIEAKPIHWSEEKKEWIQESNYYTSFPLFASNNEVVGIQIHKEDYKSFGKNTNREIGLWKSNILKSTNTIAVCEEAIDSISHSMLHNQENKIAYLATFGTPSLKHPNVIEKEMIDKGINNLIFANDYDIAGQEFNLNHILFFLNKEHDIRITDKDKSKIVVEIDKKTIDEEGFLKMTFSFKNYNSKKEKNLSAQSNDNEIKRDLLERDCFKMVKSSNNKLQFIVPRDKNALLLFNKQLLSSVGSKVNNYKLKVECSLKKDWNLDLEKFMESKNIDEKISKNLDIQQEPINKQNKLKP
jgi:hypothetical protein